MIYIPMLKTRDEELRVLKSMKDCYSDKIIPLVEVISEQYKIRYKTDENGEYIKEKRNARYYKIKLEPEEQDIITLPEINKMVENKKIFLDYFRFSQRKYGSNIKIENAELAVKLSNDYQFYKKKVVSVSKHKNMIPVISVKPEFDISKLELSDFIDELQGKSKQIALRITEEWLSIYREIIKHQLRSEDYLLFDIGEENPQTKFVELDELKKIEAKCKIILLNSPRKLAAENGEYPQHAKTDLINNCARDIAKINGLSGYGDYCGLKDAMPLYGGTKTGAALALLYDFRENVFYSYCNHRTNLGVKGYRDIIPMIEADEEILNSDGDCPGFEKIHCLNKAGGWNTWHYIKAVRYIHQTSKYL